MQSFKELEKKIIGAAALTAGALFATSFALSSMINTPKDDENASEEVEPQAIHAVDKSMFYTDQKPFIATDDFVVYEVEELGAAMAFPWTKLLTYANENENQTGFLEYDVVRDRLKLAYHAVVDDKKIEFWDYVDGPVLHNQIVKNAPQFVDHMVAANAHKAANVRLSAYNDDLAFFFNEKDSFSRDGDEISITFNALQIQCTGSLTETKDFGETGYHNLLSCKPVGL